MPSFHVDAFNERREHWWWKRWDSWVTFLEENRQNIFYLFVFYVITIALFVERFIREFSLHSLEIQSQFLSDSALIMPRYCTRKLRLRLEVM